MQVGPMTTANRHRCASWMWYRRSDPVSAARIRGRCTRTTLCVDARHPVAPQSSRYRISRELLATTATEDALCMIAASTGDNAPPAPISNPAALTAMDMP